MKEIILMLWCYARYFSLVQGQVLPDFPVRPIESDANFLIRLSPANYSGDGSGNEWYANEIPTRRISNACMQPENITKATQYPDGFRPTNLLWAWGQFIDHDIGLTPQDARAGTVTLESDDMTIPFIRSMFHSDSGWEGNPRRHVNLVTPLIDGSVVYGSTMKRAAALRTGYNGTLRVLDPNANPKTSLPPILEDVESEHGNSRPSAMFALGDVRGNEHVGLLSLHTLLIREHNRLCSRILQQYPNSSDEQVYQLARKMVGAQIQKVTYREWLPVLLGPRTVRLPQKYDPNVLPHLSYEFSTAAFRFGHSLVTSTLSLRDPQGASVGELALQDVFFQPQLLSETKSLADSILYGLCTQTASHMDTGLVDAVRNGLFGDTMDLAALNVQRGRDHGLSNYNAIRQSFRLKPKARFAQVTADSKLQRSLKDIFGSPNNMDVWVGMLAERHAKHTYIGPLAAKIIREQFRRLVRADPYFFTRDGTLHEYKDIFNIDTFVFSDLLRWNTENNMEERMVFQI